MSSARDPYKRQFLVNSTNKAIVVMLDGLGEAWNAEKLVRNDIDSIWDDRVLNWAYKVFGGVPEVRLIDRENSVPKGLKKRIFEMVTRKTRSV